MQAYDFLKVYSELPRFTLLTSLVRVARRVLGLDQIILREGKSTLGTRQTTWRMRLWNEIRHEQNPHTKSLCMIIKW